MKKCNPDILQVGCFHQDKDDLEGKDEDNPLVIACIGCIVGAFEPFPLPVVLVHYAFHVSLKKEKF